MHSCSPPFEGFIQVSALKSCKIALSAAGQRSSEPATSLYAAALCSALLSSHPLAVYVMTMKPTDC